MACTQSKRITNEFVHFNERLTRIQLAYYLCSTDVCKRTHIYSFIPLIVNSDMLVNKLNYSIKTVNFPQQIRIEKVLCKVTLTLN